MKKSGMHINSIQVLLERDFPRLARDVLDITFLQEVLELYDDAFDCGYAEGLDQGEADAESDDQEEVERLEERAWQLQSHNDDLKDRLAIAERRYEAQKKVADALRAEVARWEAGVL